MPPFLYHAQEMILSSLPTKQDALYPKQLVDPQPLRDVTEAGEERDAPP